MKIYPNELNELINYLKKIPGVGDKTAERYSLSLLKFENNDLIELGNIIKNLKKNLKKCNICGHITNDDICDICKDNNRKNNIICVVEDYKSVFMFEKANIFNGKYHILGGLISPIDGINPDDLNIKSLIDRCKKLEKGEVIFALRPTIEGNTTTLYLKKILENTKVKISRLSYGIPVGAEIDYLDVLTLEKALDDRKEVS